jgi:uncharacterized protein YndB with AHSA1/START domain
MRSVDKSITVKATPEEVWRALTEAEELKRWFPLDARSSPGVGGKIWISWGGEVQGESEITIWEPNRHLQLAEGPTKTAVDYYIEARGGETVIRLVHSGFSDSEDWNDEFETIDSGWRTFLFQLRHYLEKHPGVPRRLPHLRASSPLSRPEAWRKVGPPDVAEGERYSWNGFEGVAEVVRPPVHFAGTIENLDDGYLFIEIEPRATGSGPSVWVSTFGANDQVVDGVQQRLEAIWRSALNNDDREEGA